ncbi:MAG: hypothetical protein PHH38_06665 [Candidatus Cloacimonetes bacterium]|nr:hypothetical protein [Candidatus Cloacimonadota bacterium]
MKKALLLWLVIVPIILGITVLNASSSTKGQIEEFEVSDLPDDNGSGVILKWKPLSKENRIIKYNIYRGVSPDSLFLLTYLEVDSRLGVLAPYLYYYDTGDQPLAEFETSPMRLRKEKDQPENSPLYDKFPLNPKLLSTVLDRYNILGVTKARILHKRFHSIIKDDTHYAGLKLTHMDGIYAFPKEGVPYYYSIAAVDERGFVFPGTEVQSVAPIDNPPDATAILHAAYITDQGLFNVEWLPPNGASDIAAWQGWLVPKSVLLAPKILSENWMDSALQIFEMPNMSNSSAYYNSIEFDASEFDPEQFVPVLSYLDYAGQMAAVSANTYRHIDSSALPQFPPFKVMDKANDKGDNMLISFGKPLAYITLAEYTSKKHDRIKLNYEISENENYIVDKVKFTFRSKDGREIGSFTEKYVDKVISYRIPKEFTNIKHINAEIAVRLLHRKDYEPEVVSQQVVYNEYFRRFQPQSTFVNDVDISKLYYDVLQQSKLDWDFSNGIRANALTRTYDHIIPFEDVVYEPISGYDEASDRFLINSRLGVAADIENGFYFDVPPQKEAFSNELKEKQAKISQLEAELAASEGENLDMVMELEQLKGEYDFIINHPAYIEAEAAPNEKAWLKVILSWREKAQRSYRYKLVATDTKAAFRVSDIYTGDGDKQWFYPISQWFDTTKILTLFATILLLILVVYAIIITKKKEVYIRPIAGLQEIDNAIGRATEMGRPVMFVPGWGTLGDVCTIASLMILAQVAKKTAEYDIRLINPHCDYMVLPLAQEIVSTSYSEMGRPDSFNQNDIFFISYDQFPFCAGVNGITVRERVATIFYMGFFNAEALLLTETGNQTGAFQIAATDAVTQIPFFITTCDYTLIGEEFYAASAYLSKNHDMVSMLKAQDYFKLVIILGILVGTVLSTLNISGFIHLFPLE